MPRGSASPDPLLRERDVHSIATIWTMSELGWIGNQRGERACACGMPIPVFLLALRDIGRISGRGSVMPLPRAFSSLYHEGKWDASSL